MTDDNKAIPKPADLHAVKGAPATEEAERQAEIVAKMGQKIDVTASYVIKGAAVQDLYSIIDDVPMKYARVLLPALAGNLDRLED